MSTCIENVELYRSKLIQVVQTKTSLIIALFFTYSVYVVCLLFKHCFANSEKYQEIAQKLAKVQHDMVGKSFFFYFLTLLCSQVKSSVFAALMTYFYFAALGL